MSEINPNTATTFRLPDATEPRQPNLGMNMPANDVTFLRIASFAYEIGAARSKPRGWKFTLMEDVANVAEHCYRTTFMAMMLAVMENADPFRTAVMSLMHDCDEIRATDLTPYQKPYVTIDSEKAVHDTFAGTPLAALCLPLFKEYKDKKSLESYCVKDADIIDTVLELIEMSQRGSHYMESIPEQLGAKRDLLRTESARNLFDALATGKVSSWDWFLKGPSTFKDGTYGK